MSQISLQTIDAIQEQLCSAFCSSVALSEVEGHIVVPLPFTARDGDGLNVYLDRCAGAGWRVSDLGTTMMRLSYEIDISKAMEGSRGKLLESVLAETGTQEDDGEIFIEVPADRLASGIFAVGQAMSRVGDLSLWTRVRTESTFYDDLRERIRSSVDNDRIHENHHVPGVPGSENYPVDFKIDTDGRPLYIMGVPNRDKARLATITLQHLRSYNDDFESMIALASIEAIPQADIKRLMFAANDMIPSLDDAGEFRRKIAHRLSRA